MKRLHLEGEKYGTIEVLSFEKVDETGRSWWRCRCECGNEYFASSASGVKPDTPASEYTLGTRTLKKGSKGTDVKALQEFLLQLGYSLPRYGADGDLGAETETAL